MLFKKEKCGKEKYLDFVSVWSGSGSSPLYANFEFPLPANFAYFPSRDRVFSLSLSLSPCNRIRGGNLQLGYKTLEEEEEILDAIPANGVQGHRAPLPCALLAGLFFFRSFFLAGVPLKNS